MKSTGSQQEPFVYGSLYAEETALVPLSATALDRPEDVKGDFELVEKIGTAMAYNVFLRAHPSGAYADRARAKLKELTSTQGAPR